jgi:hypothetical protein
MTSLWKHVRATCLGRGVLVASIAGIASCAAPGAAPDPAGSAPTAPAEGVSAAMTSLPVTFLENRGQLAPEVGYWVRGRDKTLYFTPEGVTFGLHAEGGAPGRWVVKLDFVGARPDAAPAGTEPSGAVVSYFKGPRAEWRTGVPSYSEVVYRDLWPGIDLVYSGTVSRLKYSFLVRPGADPDRIQLGYRGASAVRLDAEGRLEVTTPRGGFHDDAPLAYQEIDGERVEVASSYALDESVARYGFHLGAYDHTKALVLDPAVLVYSGFIGGAGNDSGNGIAVDAHGNAYVAGTTSSTEATFPVTVGPDLTYDGGDSDAFVAKVRADGTGLVYAGYIGGSGTDSGNAIAVDAYGNAYVAGTTSSTQCTFPVTGGPDLTYNGGASDAFVAEVSADGTDLVYAGYIGGSGTDSGNGIAVDAHGNAYVTGTTNSTEATFPVTVGPDLTYNGGTSDAFVAKITPHGASFAYAGYIGGADFDAGNGIAVDAHGNAYVTGSTSSTAATFPLKVGPSFTFSGGFVTKVDPSGTDLVYSGYVPATSSASAIALDAQDNAYVTGQSVTGAYVDKVRADGGGLVYQFALAPTVLLQSFGAGVAVDGAGNAYVIWNFSNGRSVTVSKVDPTGTTQLYAFDIGGMLGQVGRAIAVDAAGNAYVTGSTSSSEALGFPVLVGPDLTHNGLTDAFVAKIAESAACTLAVTTKTITLALRGRVR